MRLATTTYDFIHYLPKQADRVRQYEGTGFRYLDYNFDDAFWPTSPLLTDDWMDDIKETAKAAEQLGFTFVQAHSPGGYDFMAPNANHEAGMLALTRSIEACAYLGITDIVVHNSTNKQMMGIEGKEAFFRENKKFYQSLFPYIEKFGVNVLIENTGYGNQDGKYFLMDAQDMLDFMKEVDHPMVKICWDTGHAHMNGYNQYKEITTLGKDVRAFHMQDNFGQADEHIPPMMGSINWDAIMQALQDIGYDGYFTLESPHVVRRSDAWPRFRRYDNLPRPTRLKEPSLELARQGIKFMYEIGKYILTQYDCFEA